MSYANQPAEDWWQHGKDAKSNRNVRLAQIDENTANELEVAWVWDLPSNDIPISEYEARQFGPQEGTPIKVGDNLYCITAASQVAKFDLTTNEIARDQSGKAVVYDPELWKSLPLSMIGFVHRGLSYWKSSTNDEHCLFVTLGDGRLVALDIDNLQPISGFGENGTVVVHQNTQPRNQPNRLGITSPPLVCRNTIIVGAAFPDLDESGSPPRGDIKAYDASSGDLNWEFRTIPTEKDLENTEYTIEDEWGNQDNADSSGHANVWTLMSADEELNMVYLPVSGGYNDSYGGDRPGNNRFSQSLCALDCKDGKIIWHQQLVHHGVWDYDLPAAPNVVDIEQNDVTHKLVVQVTKQGFAYVFDRLSGKPRWDLIETAVPKAFSQIGKEVLSPTQPIPSKPEAFDHQGIHTEPYTDLQGRHRESNILDVTKKLKQKTLKVLSNYEYGPLFSPPSMITADKLGTLQVPGYLGGASWAGAVCNPSTGKLFVSSVTQPFISAIKHNDSAHDGPTYFSAGSKSWKIKDENNSDYKLPLLKPPWGRVTCIDLNSGDHGWQGHPIAIGQGPKNNPALKQATKELPRGNWGWDLRTHLLLSDDLLFASQECRKIPIGFNVQAKTVMFKFSDDYENSCDQPSLSVFEQESGQQIASVPLPQHAQGALMGFEHNGKSTIAVPTGGYNRPAKIIGLRLKSTIKRPAYTLSKGSSKKAAQPEKYIRTIWEGQSTYTGLVNGWKGKTEHEILSLVRAFDIKGGMLPTYQAAYLSNLRPKSSTYLRLFLTANNDLDTKSAWPPGNQPARLYTKLDQSGKNELATTESLRDFFEANGHINVWNLKPDIGYCAWEYVDFLGMPIHENNKSMSSQLNVKQLFYISGTGHLYNNRIIRTMTYSIKEDGITVPLFMRSSTLKKVSTAVLKNQFENFS